MTPELPRWIRDTTVDGYTNLYAMIPDESRLFGTEDLYGDWDGRVLLLAKDFACSSLVHERLVNNDPRPYRHEPDLRTNKRLRRLFDSFTTGSHSDSCGLLYGSALACLLRDDGRMSGSLPNRGAAIGFGQRVLQFTISKMPNLSAIVCLGDEAWDCTMLATGSSGRWQEYRDHGSALHADGVALIGAFHPAARVSNDRFETALLTLRRVLDTDRIAKAA